MARRTSSKTNPLPCGGGCGKRVSVDEGCFVSEEGLLLCPECHVADEIQRESKGMEWRGGYYRNGVKLRGNFGSVRAWSELSVLFGFLLGAKLSGASDLPPLPPGAGKKYITVDPVKGATKLLSPRKSLAAIPLDRYTLRDVEIVESLAVTNWTVSVNSNQWTFDTKLKVFAVSNLVYGVQYYLGANHPSAGPASVSLAWDASTGQNIAGYQAYVGESSRNYTDQIDTGDAATLTATFNDLVAGKTYFFAATAYNTVGLESEFSDELIHTPPAGAVAGMVPSALRLAGTTDTPTNQFPWPPLNVPRETYVTRTLQYSNAVTGAWESMFSTTVTNPPSPSFWAMRSDDTSRAQIYATSASGPWTDVPGTESPGPAPGPARFLISVSDNSSWINAHQFPE